MNSNNLLFWQLLLQLVLISVNALFAGAEIAVITINDNKLAKMSAAGNKRAIRLSKLTKQPGDFLATIQVAITLAGFLGSAFAAKNFAGRLTQWLIGLGVGISEVTLNTVAVVVITLVLSYLTLVLGELLPKRIAMRKAEKFALAMSGTVYVISKIFAPVVWILSVSTNGLLRLFGIDPNADDRTITEEEIRMMVDEGSEKGAIDPDEKIMIHRIFEFDDISASEVMTYRTDVSVLWLSEDDGKWDERIMKEKHSIYPVCSGSIDKVVGLLYTKDYFRLRDKSRSSVMNNAVREAYFIPETIKIDILFRNMKKTRKHFAIAVDEHGGVVGIVTMNDLLEQIVGDLEDDMSEIREQPAIEKLENGQWRISGSAPLSLVSEQLGIMLPEYEYNTFGGMIFDILGNIPEDGSTVELEKFGMLVKITEIKGRRIKSAIVSPIKNKGKK